MPEKELSYIEFRYSDGTKQCLRGKEAQDWIEFTKYKLAIAHKIDQSYNCTWNWERFSAKDEIPDRPGVIDVKKIPPVDVYSEYENFY
jgi:hypothetical protein